MILQRIRIPEHILPFLQTFIQTNHQKSTLEVYRTLPGQICVIGVSRTLAPVVMAYVSGFECGHGQPAPAVPYKHGERVRFLGMADESKAGSIASYPAGVEVDIDSYKGKTATYESLVDTDTECSAHRIRFQDGVVLIVYDHEISKWNQPLTGGQPQGR